MYYPLGFSHGLNLPIVRQRTAYSGSRLTLGSMEQSEARGQCTHMPHQWAAQQLGPPWHTPLGTTFLHSGHRNEESKPGTAWWGALASLHTGQCHCGSAEPSSSTTGLPRLPLGTSSNHNSTTALPVLSSWAVGKLGTGHLSHSLSQCPRDGASAPCLPSSQGPHLGHSEGSLTVLEAGCLLHMAAQPLEMAGTWNT